jgi:mRNA-degrading endonuclease RelE of RelBE toxin-antitoxin system
MYKIRLFEEAERNFERLDKTIARRILRKLNWLAENAAMIEPKSLRKNLSGFCETARRRLSDCLSSFTRGRNSVCSFHRSSKRSL